MHFCLDVVTVCRWDKKFRGEGMQGLRMNQKTATPTKKQKTQEQAELKLEEENLRLRMGNDYLKKLNALIQKREKSKWPILWLPLRD